MIYTQVFLPLSSHSRKHFPCILPNTQGLHPVLWGTGALHEAGGTSQISWSFSLSIPVSRTGKAFTQHSSGQADSALVSFSLNSLEDVPKIHLLKCGHPPLGYCPDSTINNTRVFQFTHILAAHFLLNVCPNFTRFCYLNSCRLQALAQPFPTTCEVEHQCVTKHWIGTWDALIFWERSEMRVVVASAVSPTST